MSTIKITQFQVGAWFLSDYFLMLKQIVLKWHFWSLTSKDSSGYKLIKDFMIKLSVSGFCTEKIQIYYLGLIFILCLTFVNFCFKLCYFLLFLCSLIWCFNTFFFGSFLFLFFYFCHVFCFLCPNPGYDILDSAGLRKSNDRRSSPLWLRRTDLKQY